jgi:hypothetical protein
LLLVDYIDATRVTSYRPVREFRGDGGTASPASIFRGPVGATSFVMTRGEVSLPSGLDYSKESGVPGVATAGCTTSPFQGF